MKEKTVQAQQLAFVLFDWFSTNQKQQFLFAFHKRTIFLILFLFSALFFKQSRKQNTKTILIEILWFGLQLFGRVSQFFLHFGDELLQGKWENFGKEFP